ncbi:MAG: transglutaminase family protein [Acidiferrobacter sp.]
MPLANDPLALVHEIYYHYDAPARLGPHIIRLRPTLHHHIAVQDYHLTVAPVPDSLYWQEDPFGNSVARAVFAKPTTHLHITAKTIMVWRDINPLDFVLEETAAQWPPLYDPRLLKPLSPYLEVSARGAHFKAFIAEHTLATLSTVGALSRLGQAVARQIAYTARLDPGIQSCDATLASGAGSCRDSAWLLIQAVRSLGLPARFVSGYLVEMETGPEASAPNTGDRLALHAWADIFLPGAGWIGLDATSGLFAGPGHLPLACAPDPLWTAPVEGTCEKSALNWGFSHTVTRLAPLLPCS